MVDDGGVGVDGLGRWCGHLVVATFILAVGVVEKQLLVDDCKFFRV